MIEVIEEVPYGSRDVSNVDIDISIPISVEVIPHKVYLIEENSYSGNHSVNHSVNHSGAYLNFHIVRSENRIRDINRENDQNILKRIKCILYTMVSIPITILLLGYTSTIWGQ
jgi:hypothetical protein